MRAALWRPYRLPINDDDDDEETVSTVEQQAVKVDGEKRIMRLFARHVWRTVAIGCAALLVLPGAAWALAPGDFDPTFGAGGVVTEQFGTGANPETNVRATAVQDDGKVIAVGAVYEAADKVFVARFNADGSLDQSFGNGGKLVVQFGSGNSGSEAFSVAVQPDGKIVLGGWANDSAGNGDLLLARLNPNGALDPTFGTGGMDLAALGGGASGEQDAEAHEVALQPDGKLVVGGLATNNSGQPELLVARFNGDGSLDPSFGSGGRVLSSSAQYATAIALQGDGKVVASGYAYTSAQGSEVLLTRFNADGSVDSSFAGGGTLAMHLGVGSPASGINALTVQPDGKILGAGFADDADNEDSLVIRLNRDGSFDSSFGTGGEALDEMGMPSSQYSPRSSLSSIAVQANGRIVVGGLASDTNGNDALLLARLTENGTRDPSFGSGGTILRQLGATTSPYSYINSVGLTNDGKAVMAGPIKDTNSFTELLLIRVIADLPPIASFTASSSTVPAGAAVSFAALGSGDPDGAITRYRWDFADGSTGSTATPSHTFAHPGTYAVTLTVTDDDALTATTTQTVTVTAAAPSLTPPPGPRFLHVFETVRRWREGTSQARTSRKRRPPVGTKFGFTLNESANVVLSFTRKLPGRRVGPRCIAPNRHNHGRPRCARTLVAGRLAFHAHAGANTVRFAGRISSKRKLKPGAYTVTLTATDAAGRRAMTELTFTIVKG